MVRTVFIAVAVVLLATAHLQAQPDDFSEVDAVVEQFLRSSLASGVGLIITTPEEAIYEKSYGDAVDGEVVELFSSSKTPTTTAILTLVGEGLIGLDDRVADYLPDWPADKQDITLRQCLSCTAGFGLKAPPAGRKSLAEQVADIAGEPLLFPPGTEFSYTGSGFQVAGRVAEVVTGQTWHELFQERIAVPLQLQTYDYGSSAGINLPGGAVSSLQDYAKILRLHLNDGRQQQQQILTAELAREMRTDQVGNLPVRRDLGLCYGLSWWISIPESPEVSLQFSDQGATGSTPWIDPQRRYGAMFYLKGVGSNLVTASRLYGELSAALAAEFGSVENATSPPPVLRR